ncbi:MAG: oligosaccharide flippase family protein, partial [Alistipes sp.]
MLESLKTKTVNGVFWSSVERFSVQAIQFTISLLIARVLTPADYGVIGMLAIFMALSQTFIDSGFSNALIRKTNRTEVDNSTVFYFNIAVGLLFYALLYLAAPAIAQFY